MNYRAFGKTGQKISEVALGTWQLGGSDWGPMEKADAMAVMEKAVESGVNFFDTADVYGLGTSERLIGEFLKTTKAKVHVATKLCRADWVRAGGWPEPYTLEMARSACRESCRNLGVESLFLQQWHCPPTAWMRSGEIFEHLETLKADGLIQHWGVSVESVDEALICMEHPGCAALQVIYNIFRQKLTDELLPVAKRKGVGILARVPLASGLLTGRFVRGQKFPETDHRHYNADGAAFNVGETFAGLPFETGMALAQEVKAILKPAPEAAMAQQSLRWILDHDAVSAVIPGATRPSQAVSNAAASAMSPLGPQVHKQLRDLYDKKVHGAIRGPY